VARARPGHRGARKLLATLDTYDAGATLTPQPPRNPLPATLQGPRPPGVAAATHTLLADRRAA